ncbi:MAG: hypothetical protein ACOCVZ_02980 [Gemmatimonadota bacterium]
MVAVGEWSTEALEGRLLVGGGDAAVERTIGRLRLAVSVGAVNAGNGSVEGTFVRGGLRGSYSLGGWSVVARLHGQRSPVPGAARDPEPELGADLSLVGELAPGTRLRVHAGRSVRDPLFGTAGTVVFSAGVSVQPVRWSAPPPTPVARVGERRDGDGRSSSRSGRPAQNGSR